MPHTENNKAMSIHQTELPNAFRMNCTL